MKQSAKESQYTFSNSISFSLFALFSGLAIATSCTPKPAVVTGSKTMSAEYIAQGKTIFENSCAKCHDLPNPDDHSATDWVGLVNSMAPKAKLTDKQHEMVYDYIISAKK